MTEQVLEWLLGDDQPSVRYHALLDLLDRGESDPDAKEALAMIPSKGWGADLLKKKKPGGYWESEEELYAPKYIATNWLWLILADLGLAREMKLKKTCELIIQRFMKPDGGFGWKQGHFCTTGNAARTLILSGYEDDPRVASALDWIVNAQKDDGGWHCFESKTGTLDCWEGLSAFAVLPRSKWTRSVKGAAERGAEFYLERRLFDDGMERYEPWFRFHYPIHYYYDILAGLDILTRLGYGDDKRLRPALEILREKRSPEGRWLLDSVHPDVPPGGPYRAGTWPPGFPVIPLALESVGEPSKWITLTALKVLKRVEES